MLVDEVRLDLCHHFEGGNFSSINVITVLDCYLFGQLTTLEVLLEVV